MLIFVAFIIAFTEFIFIPTSITSIMVFLLTFLGIIFILEVLSPKAPRPLYNFSQSELQNLFGVSLVELGFEYDPENISVEKFRLSVENPHFHRGIKITIPFSYEQNSSAYVDFSYNLTLPQNQTILSSTGVPIVRAELVREKGKPTPLRGPIPVKIHPNLYTDRFYLDHSILSCRNCKIYGYIVVLNSRFDYAVYRFPPLVFDIKKRRVEYQDSPPPQNDI